METIEQLKAKIRTILKNTPFTVMLDKKQLKAAYQLAQMDHSSQQTKESEAALSAAKAAYDAALAQVDTVSPAPAAPTPTKPVTPAPAKSTLPKAAPRVAPAASKPATPAAPKPVVPAVPVAPAPAAPVVTETTDDQTQEGDQDDSTDDQTQEGNQGDQQPTEQTNQPTEPEKKSE